MKLNNLVPGLFFGYNMLSMPVAATPQQEALIHLKMVRMAKRQEVIAEVYPDAVLTEEADSYIEALHERMLTLLYNYNTYVEQGYLGKALWAVDRMLEIQKIMMDQLGIAAL